LKEYVIIFDLACDFLCGTTPITGTEDKEK
jgi:hypothetical protein